MGTRMLLTGLVILCSFANPLMAQDAKTAAKPGAKVVLNLTGEFANTYARFSGAPHNQSPADETQISVIGVVVERISESQVRIEHKMSDVINDKTRTLTLSIVVDDSKLLADLMPKGTAYYRSPGDHAKGLKPLVSTEDVWYLRLIISSLPDLKQQTWELSQTRR